MKKALIIMPAAPFPAVSAEEQNRVGCFRLLQELGFTEISIIAKGHPEQLVTSYASEETQYGVSLTFVPRKDKTVNRFTLSRVLNPFRWDGAANEYFDELLEQAIRADIAKRKPELLFIHYNFVWPSARIARNLGIPVIVRSHNFEAFHFLSEDGMSFANLFKFFAKLLTEWRSLRIADQVLAVTEKEAQEYRILASQEKVHALHSAALPYILEKPRHSAHDRIRLKLLFMGARYTVPHNLKALQFLVQEVMPTLEKTYPNTFELIITGSKLPESVSGALPKNTTYLGYVENLDTVLADADAALAPHIGGHGMQLKVFEPLVLGMPVITSKRVLGGYAFPDGEAVLCAEDAEDFVRACGKLLNIDFRRYLGDNARMRAEELFGKKRSLVILKNACVAAGAL